MAKSKNHTAHNQSYKAHKGGIKKVKATKYSSTRGVSDADRLSNDPDVTLQVSHSNLCWG